MKTLLADQKLTIPQAAKLMGIGTTSLRRIIAEGGIPVLRMTGRTLLLESDVEEFIRASRVVITTAKAKPIRSALPRLPIEVINSKHLR